MRVVGIVALALGGALGVAGPAAASDVAPQQGSALAAEAAASGALTARIVSVDHGSSTAVVAGTGAPGATITVTTPTGDHATTVGDDGAWMMTVSGLAPGENTLAVRQSLAGSTTVTIVVGELNPPIIDPAIGFGALAAAGGALALTMARRGRVVLAR
jgi:hypothetical protein